MAHSAGDKLGPYEILAPIGKGGMGVVFRSRDSRLNRDVAVIVSAERFGERFEREARAVAALNHPNICHLYDVGPDYLVMELVEGPTLAERIENGPIPLEEALNIARQIAEALEAAHEKGITHRDLKPGNVKIKPDGTVKVLDFGLAKMGGTPVVPSDASPTMTMGQTEAGMILGTAAYMSPEQAKGKPVDQRADIYSFGAVLYEMVTGERLHHGETTTDVLASVIKEEPKWERVPPQLQRLLRRCLEKDPQKRQRHIGDVMALVDSGVSGGQAVVLPQRARRGWLWPSAAVAAIALAGVVWWAPWRGATTAPAIRFEIPPTEKLTFINGSYPMVSPNGKWVVFPAIGADNVRRMYLRSLDSVEVRPLAGTESDNPLQPPVYWSPDSRYVVFSSNPGPFTPGQLKKLDISGGPPTTICEMRGVMVGLTWNRDGVIVFADNVLRTLMRVSAAGGVATPVTVMDPSRSENFHLYPQFLPDGKHFLYYRLSNNPQYRGTYVGSIEAKPEEQSLKPVMLGDRQVTYTASLIGGPGRLLFMRDTTLFAQPFDPGSFQLTGEPVPVADQVGSFAPANAGLYSVSDNGVLAYRVGAGGDQVQLTWFDAQGKITGTVGEKGTYRNPAVSPDGTRVAVTQLDRSTSGGSNIWVLDIARGNSIKVTFNAGRNDFPVWSPDGKSIVFASNRAGHMDLYLKGADGSGEERLVFKSEFDKRPTAWSKDGRFLLFMAQDPKTQDDIWVLPDPLGPAENAKPVLYLGTEFQEGLGTFSPDGRWVAYLSGESGAPELYVRPFYADKIAESAAGGRWLVSKGAFPQLPRWRADGGELYYRAPSLQIMAVEVHTAKAFEASPARAMFSTAVQFPGDVTTDGKRFVYPAPEGSNAPSPFTVVTNWQAVLKK
jgi:Tol biopolymer transport system component/predicted Ser/Thr protein kinase